MIGGLAASKLCQTFYISMYECLSMYDFRNINGISIFVNEGNTSLN